MLPEGFYVWQCDCGYETTSEVQAFRHVAGWHWDEQKQRLEDRVRRFISPNLLEELEHVRQ